MLRAAIAGFLVASAPMFMMLDQEARPYPLLIFAYAVAVLGVLRLFREFQENAPGSWLSWLVLATGTELSLWAHGLGILYAVSTALTLAPAWLKVPINRDRIMRGISVALVVALLYLPCLWIVVARAGDWGSGWLSLQTDALLQFLQLYLVPIEKPLIVSAIAAIILLLLIKRAVQSPFRIRGWTAEKAILVLWWTPPIAAIAMSVLFEPVFLPRTLAASLIPAYLALSGAAATIDGGRERKAICAMLCAALLALSFLVGVRPASEEWVKVGDYLNSHVGTSDQVWLYPSDSALPLQEAGANMARVHGIPGDFPNIGFKGPIRAGSPAVVSLTHDQADLTARDRRYANVPVIWLVTRQAEIFDPANDLSGALGRVRRPGTALRWRFTTVQPYYQRN
jgi:hypothetical protein